MSHILCNSHKRDKNRMGGETHRIHSVDCGDELAHQVSYDAGQVYKWSLQRHTKLLCAERECVCMCVCVYEEVAIVSCDYRVINASMCER